MGWVRLLSNVRRVRGLVVALILAPVAAALLVTYLTAASAGQAPFPPLTGGSGPPDPGFVQTPVKATQPSGSIALAAPGAPLPSGNVKLEQWETIPSGNWITGNLGSSNSDYNEGEVVPFQLTIGHQVDAGSYEFSVCRDYENGTRRGYLFLDVFNTSRAALPGAPITSTNVPFSGANATIDSFTEVAGQGACAAGQRQTIVQITKSVGEAYVLWGGHLASPLDPGVGAGNGASSLSGSSLHMRIIPSGKDVSINPGAIIPAPTPTPMNTPTNTPIPTNTPTNTPTETPTPTNTPIPPTDTPTPTDTPVPPTETPTPTNTPIPPTDTPTPTDTPVPPTDTPTPTDTPVPPTDTPTPTDTPVPPTDTPVPTATDTPSPTETVAPVATATPVNTPAPTATAEPSVTGTPPPTATAEPSATGTPPTVVPTTAATSTAVPTSTVLPASTAPAVTPLAAATSEPAPAAVYDPPPASTRITQVLPIAVTPTRARFSQVLAAPSPVIRELPRTGSGPDDGWFPWLAVLGGTLAVAGSLLLYRGLRHRLSGTER